MNNLNKITIGDRIKEKRRSKKITQKQLSKILNKSESSIQKYESGEVEIPHSVIEEIAKVLDTTAPYLLGYDDGQKLLDEIKLFNEQLKQLGCHINEFYCPKEDNPKTISCNSNGTERFCSNCDLKQSCYILTYNNTTINIPINALENLRDNFKSYMQFMLLELIKKYK